MNTETTSTEYNVLDHALKLARNLGGLQGTAKILLEYGNLDDSNFKLLAEGLIETLDPESEWDVNSHMWIMSLAEKRNIELDA